MPVKLTIVKRRKIITEIYDTVTDAYRRYLSRYSTFGDWFYYWRRCGLKLNQITDEETMESIFTYVFRNASVMRERR